MVLVQWTTNVETAVEPIQQDVPIAEHATTMQMLTAMMARVNLIHVRAAQTQQRVTTTQQLLSKMVLV